MSDMPPLLSRLMEHRDASNSCHVGYVITITEAQLQALVAEQVALAVAEHAALLEEVLPFVDAYCNATISPTAASESSYVAMRGYALINRAQQEPKPPQVGTMPCKTCGADRAKEPCKHRDISQCVMRGVAQQEQKGGDE